MTVRGRGQLLALLLALGAAGGVVAGLPVGPVGVAAADAPDCGTVSFDGGDGSAANPYRIATLDGLQCVREEPGASYELVADVDAAETAGWNDGRGFEPVGGSGTAFTGTFDGTGHEIRGFTIDRRSFGVGLFGRADGATIRNVRLVDANVTGADRVGALVGDADGARVAYSVVSGTVAGRDHVGGLVGLNGGGAGVIGSSAAATVDGDIGVGGLVGTNERRSRVETARATGAVTGGQQVGGLVGHNDHSVVANATATGEATGRVGVGGLVGLNEVDGVIRRSNASASVTHSGDGIYAGGLVGLNEENGTVRASYATGAVDGFSGVGGLVGTNQQNSTVVGTYAAGAVSGKHAGGLVGVNRENSTVADSYWDVDATGRTSSAGQSGGGLSTGEMTGEAPRQHMAGLDFAGTWTTTGAYPALSRDVETGPVTGLIAVHDQTVEDGTATVLVASANASVDYYVEVVDTDGTTAGTATFAAGDRRTDLAVDLGVPLADRTSLTATVRAAADDSALATDAATVTIRSQNRADSPLSGVAGTFDANADGAIDVAELGDAGRAFARGALSIGELGTVARAFARD